MVDRSMLRFYHMMQGFQQYCQETVLSPDWLLGHIINHSAGTNHLLSVLLRRFWVVAGWEVIKECTNNCMICKKNKAGPPPQLMAPLQQIRLMLSIRAFSNVGIDFAGSFLTIHGQGKTWNKRCLCLHIYCLKQFILRCLGWIQQHF